METPSVPPAPADSEMQIGDIVMDSAKQGWPERIHQRQSWSHAKLGKASHNYL